MLKAPKSSGCGHMHLYMMCVVGKAVPRGCFSLDLLSNTPSLSFS